MAKLDCTVDVGWVEMSKHNFVVNRPKFLPPILVPSSPLREGPHTQLEDLASQVL